MGRKSMHERDPYVVKAAQEMKTANPSRSLRRIARELLPLGYGSKNGVAFVPSVIRDMLATKPTELQKGIEAYEARKAKG